MTIEETLEFVKCAEDPIYFLNRYGYVFDIGKNNVDRLTLFGFQENILNNFMNYRNNIVLKSRQMGLSVVTSGYVCWKLLFNENERILIVANDGNGARRFLASVKQFLDYLPKFLLPDAIPTNNTQQIVFSNGSFCKAVASGENAGRGETLTLLVMDETAFIENAENIWMAASLALSAESSKCIMLSCVPEETFVFTDKGLTQIKNFINKDKKGGYYIDNYNILGKDNLRNGNLFHNNGFQKTKKIFTTNSYVEGTYNHKLWACKNGIFDWYKMEDLNEGDYISIQYGHEKWGKNDDVSDFEPQDTKKCLNKFNPKKITKEIAYFLGLFLAEGSVYKCYNKKNIFVGGSVTITCGDDISKAIKDMGLKYYLYKDNLHYTISSKQLILFLEYLGFDLSKKAKEKYIPQRLLEMSRENIIYLLKGIFDGDGYSRSDRGYVGISLNSKLMIEQIRMLLLNFGILTDYSEVWSKPTKKVVKSTLGFRILCNARNSEIFYEKINFGFKRKQYNRAILGDVTKYSVDNDDVIPFSSHIYKKIIKESGKTKVFVEDKKIGFHKNYNKNNKHVSRKVFLNAFNLLKKHLTQETIIETEKFLSNNLKWNKINKIEYSEKETYDFSLPENEKDFWCHSVIYNGVLGHQTPKGTGSLFHSTWVGAVKKTIDFHPTEIHWKDHPIYSKNSVVKTDEYGKKFVWSPWYEKQCEKFKYDKVKIAQELDLSFEGSASVVIENHILERYEKDIADVKPICFYDYKEIGNKFVDNRETTFQVWEKPIKGKNYILGGDVGRGDGSDYSTVQIIDADSLIQVAEYQGKIQPDSFANLIYNIAKDYNEAFVAVEGNSFGLATTLKLRNELKYPAEKIYHSKSIKKIYVRYADYEAVDANDEIPGFQTTSKTRPLIIECMRTYMREGEVKINSKRLLNEFKTFIFSGDKAEHAPSYHDDLIFAFAIALFMRNTEFNNIFQSQDFFKAMLDGISHSTNNRNIVTGEKIEKVNEKNTKDDDLGWLYGPITG